MKNTSIREVPPALTLEVYEPGPHTLYSLEVTAHLARVPRRSILIYCRAGLVRPVWQSPYGVMAFSEESIHVIRRIEQIRTQPVDLAWLKTVCGLLDEVERLRLEVRFLRG
jgi:DNA-binding transcriptional MerR regulator